jgi:hypothetical protein
MIDSDQCPYLNQLPLLKSASTDKMSDIRVFSNHRSFQILRSTDDLLIRVQVRAYVSDVIGHRFEKVRNGHRFENLDADLRI